MKTGHHRIASHLEGCQRCRNDVAFRRDLHHAASVLRRPEPPPHLLAEILRDRVAGERIILPGSAQNRGRLTRQGLRAAAVVGALIGVALIARYVNRSSETTSPSFLSATVFFPGIASASEPSAPRARLDPVAPQIDARQLRIREASYQQQRIDAAGTRTIAGEGTTTVRPVVVAGSAAWRIERTWLDYATAGAPQSKEIDSMLLDARDFHFIERYIDAAPYGKYSRLTVTQKFGGDSVYGRMVSEGADSRGVAAGKYMSHTIRLTDDAVNRMGDYMRAASVAPSCGDCRVHRHRLRRMHWHLSSSRRYASYRAGTVEFPCWAGRCATTMSSIRLNSTSSAASASPFPPALSTAGIS